MTDVLCRCIYPAHCYSGSDCALKAGGTVNDGGGVCPPKGTPTEPSTDLANVNAAYVVERDEAQRLVRENEDLKEQLAVACGNPCADCQSENERLRAELICREQDIEALKCELRAAIDALEGRPQTVWNTDTARDVLAALSGASLMTALSDTLIVVVGGPS